MKRCEKLLQLMWVVVVMSLVFVGCSTDNPVVPNEANTSGRVVQSTTGPVTILGMDQAQKDGASLAKSEAVDVHVEQFIDASEGGEIVLGNGDLGFSKIIFEPNALPEDMTISITYREDEYCEGIFEPHGTVFNVPVRIELSYLNADLTNVNEEELEVYYYNESTGLWEVVGGDVDVPTKSVSVYLEHFSRYAIVKT